MGTYKGQLKTSLKMPGWLHVIVYLIDIGTIARFCSGRSSTAYGAETHPIKTEILNKNTVTLPTTYKMFNWTMKHTEKKQNEIWSVMPAIFI